MRREMLLAAVVALPLLGSSARAEEPYSCITDQTVGFGFDTVSKQWLPTHFGGGQKFTLRPVVAADADDPQTGSIIQDHLVGGRQGQQPDDLLFLSDDNPLPLATCRQYRIGSAANLICHPWTGMVEIDLPSLRFMVAYLGSYASANSGEALAMKVPPDPGFIGYGICSNLP